MTMRMRRHGRLGNRGVLLISSYLVLSLFLMYSSAMTLRTNSLRVTSDGLRDRFQAMDLAQGALEQVRNDLYEYFRVDVYHDRYHGDALAAMGWLDAMDPGFTGRLDPDPASSGTWRMYELVQSTTANLANTVTGAGTQANPRRISLPSMAGKSWIAEAWVADVAPVGGMLGPRDVTFEARVYVPGNPPAIVRRIRSVYRYELSASDIFRYAYFVNNYGWFDMWNGALTINGDVRSNGDFRFSGSTGSMQLQGDIYASRNVEIKDPVSGQTARGLIRGDPWQTYWEWYWQRKNAKARPERRKVVANPPIGGTAPAPLPYGQGWDTVRNGSVPYRPEQQRFERQATQDIPYLGDLTLYRALAQEKRSTLTYATPGVDGVYGSRDDGEATVNAVQQGNRPLIVVGTEDHPIRIDGPVVVDGDVIIKGVVRGQGTIYAGRNVHVVGDIIYKDPPVWPSLERDGNTGQIRTYNSSLGPDLGSVCSNGAYKPASAGPASSRCR